MTDFYVDLAADFVNRSGADSSTNVATGPGGLLAVIHGRGAVTTAIAAGDTCYLKGTGGLRQLANLTCGKDVAAAGWAIGDSVQDNNTGSEWTGKIIYVSTTTCHVQVNSGKTYSNITTGSGIKNTDRSNDTTTLSAKANLGITFNNSGSAAGYIKFIGVEGTGWTVDGTRFTIEADSIGTTPALYIEQKNYLWFQHIEIDHPDNTGIDRAGSGASHHVYIDMYLHDADSYGIAGYGVLTYFTLIQCVISGCGNTGSYQLGNSVYVACRFSGNSGAGAESYTGGLFFGCVAYENATANLILRAYGCAVNCVCDDVSGSNALGISASVAKGWAIGCRSTNNSESGQEGFSGASNVNLMCVQCYAGNNTDDYDSYCVEFDCTSSGEDVDQGYADPGSPNYDYNLASDATKRSVAVELD